MVKPFSVGTLIKRHLKSNILDWLIMSYKDILRLIQKVDSVSGSLTSPFKPTPPEQNLLRWKSQLVPICRRPSHLNALARSTKITLIRELRDFGRLIVMIPIPPGYIFSVCHCFVVSKQRPCAYCFWDMKPACGLVNFYRIK